MGIHDVLARLAVRVSLAALLAMLFAVLSKKRKLPVGLGVILRSSIAALIDTGYI